MRSRRESRPQGKEGAAASEDATASTKKLIKHQEETHITKSMKTNARGYCFTRHMCSSSLLFTYLGNKNSKVQS